MTNKTFVIGANGIEEIDRRTAVVKVNQILISHHPCGTSRHVVTEIVQGGSGIIYKTINTETAEHGQKDYIKPLSRQSGIGTYYNDSEPEFMDAIEVSLLKTKANEIREERDRKAEQERIETLRLKAIGRERLEKLLPENMQALIVAEERENDSDPYTDYFGYTVGRTVILGYSMTKRNNFSEMRQMAKRFGETAHLAEYNKDHEHRENYSGGGGYYLGTSRYSGWVIQKESYRTREQFIETYAVLAGNEENICFSATDTTAPQTAEPIQADVVRIVDYSEKAIAVYGDTRPIKDTLKSLGGKFNFRLTINGETVAGWIFPKTKTDEVKTALSI